MRALTLIQPFAGLIAFGSKRVENRTWQPPDNMIGQRFAIHAGAKIDRVPIEDLLRDGHEPHASWKLKSALLCVATLDRWVADAVTSGRHSPSSLTHEEAAFYNGPIAFVLRDVVAIPEPVPCKGMLGFWTLSDDVERAVHRQLGEPCEATR